MLRFNELAQLKNYSEIQARVEFEFALGKGSEVGSGLDQHGKYYMSQAQATF